MNLDLKWNDAVAAFGDFMSPREKAAGWPAHMRLFLAALMQRLLEDELLDKRERNQAALKKSLFDAVNDGSLPTHKTDLPDKPPIYFVAPQDFAEWLHAQDEPPSMYVTNWFKASGVVWPPVVRGRGAAPATTGVQAAAGADTQPLQRWRAQENAILEKIKELGYIPECLPAHKHGKSGVKAEIRKASATSIL